MFLRIGRLEEIDTLYLERVWEFYSELKAERWNGEKWRVGSAELWSRALRNDRDNMWRPGKASRLSQPMLSWSREVKADGKKRKDGKECVVERN